MIHEFITKVVLLVFKVGTDCFFTLLHAKEFYDSVEWFLILGNYLQHIILNVL